MKTQGISIKSEEIESLNQWLKTNPNLPGGVKETISKLSSLPDYLYGVAQDKEAFLRLLRTFLKILPSSEEGSVVPK